MTDHEVNVWRDIAKAAEQRERIATDRLRLVEDQVREWETLAREKNWGYVHDERMDALSAENERLRRLLYRAYPWLHCPYTPQGSTDEWTQFQALIREIEHVIAHLKDEDDPPVALPCASCDGDGCPNCLRAKQEAGGGSYEAFLRGM